MPRTQDVQNARPPKAPLSARVRKLRRRQWALGLLATVACAAIWLAGGLEFLERLALDWRARWFDGGSPAPAQAIALVAIDDAAQSSVGRWPWPRARVASVVRELTRAGVKVVALDITFERPSEDARGIARADEPPGGVSPDDAELAKAIAEHGNVIVAGSFPLRLGGQAVPVDPKVVRIPIDRMLGALADEPDLRTMPRERALEELKTRLLPPAMRALTRGPELDELREKFDAALTLLEAAPRSSLPVQAQEGAMAWPASDGPLPPLRAFAQSAADLANVTFDSYDPDGLVRRVPIFIHYRQRLWPSLGLVAALRYMNIPLQQVRVEGHDIVVPRPGQEPTRLRLAPAYAGGASVDGLYLVAWPRGTLSKTLPDDKVRGSQWQFWDVQRGVPGEYPIGRVYEPTRIGEMVRDNLASVRRGVSRVYLNAELKMLEPEQEAAWAELDPLLERAGVDDAGFADLLARARPLVTAAGDAAKAYLEFAAPPGADLTQISPADRDRIENLRAANAAVPRALGLAGEGLENIVRLRAEMRERLGGKLVIVGWTATGSNADFLVTSIDPRTPGPLVHAAVANSVLTGFTRRGVPLWADLLAILGMGVVGTVIGIRATVVLAPALGVAVIAGWFLLSGAVLWNYWWLITAVAGPAAAAAAGVGVVMLHRLTVEQRSRRKTEERFKSYLSPAVVDILVNNPELDSMKPWRKTLSIMFTDLAGFTTTAERLGGDRTAEVLALFLGRMTEIVQSTGATLDKYIGDAIVAFWGAPVDDADHARHACRAAVKMIAALDELNARGAFGDAGALVMRVGIASGEVMVGDFGNPPRNSSYTVIGDTANLASRLEGANKAFGSRILVSQATRELAGDEFVFRLIGDVKVKGRTGATRLYELIGDLAPKGARTAEWIAATEAAGAEYRARRFEPCLVLLDRLEREFQDPCFAAMYREQIDLYRANGSEGFDGSITLTEK